MKNINLFTKVNKVKLRTSFVSQTFQFSKLFIFN
ncbi:hypothetical protein SDIMI_v3c01250 [Spiroplasma diminutum CUAS-1]|uniref:Uncharacterized protein n=1 Tax=Spiroplasma diminutum CUAS-1 TaxID=1276221 RepID=S5LVI8_9MOLU|nr:hypothetical protein SDIMI_v3c01250 [Spiroplasma diminutum CUAS-1]